MSHSFELTDTTTPSQEHRPNAVFTEQQQVYHCRAQMLLCHGVQYPRIDERRDIQILLVFLQAERSGHARKPAIDSRTGAKNVDPDFGIQALSKYFPPGKDSCAWHSKQAFCFIKHDRPDTSTAAHTVGFSRVLADNNHDN